MEEPSEVVTQQLVAHAQGDTRAVDELMPLVYTTLRRLAGHLMQQEGIGHTLQPTALVHEAYIQLVQIDRVSWECKAHFLNMAAKQMRRILVDHARGKNAEKRGGQLVRVSLDERLEVTSSDPTDFLLLDELLTRLARRNPRQSRVCELRIFGGLRIHEVAHVLDVSERTVKNDWRFARAWLAKELGPPPDA